MLRYFSRGPRESYTRVKTCGTGIPMLTSIRRTCKSGLAVILVSAAFCMATDATSDAKKRADELKRSQTEAVLWRDPGDIAARNLFYGSGGRAGEPHGPYVFLKEDLTGTNPKFDVRDRDGVRWQVKLGIEAQPETAAARLVWAVGYPTAEYYFLPELRVGSMPPHLKRGQNLIASDGTIHNVRLKRHGPHLKKIGIWHWGNNPFSGTREFNGLRVMMALINNWDLKDENNSIFELQEAPGSSAPAHLYMVSDLGATFGSTGRTWPTSRSKGDLESYRDSVLISNVTPEYVDFNVPTRPAIAYAVTTREFIRRLHLRWIGRQIPRSDVQWIARLLAHLSQDQIRAAFRAAGYSPGDVEGFTRVVLQRIAQLNKL